MNLDRRRSMGTLGDYPSTHPHCVKSRRSDVDPFERDPFKVQSYNFRYAERPTYPLQQFLNYSSPIVESFYNNNNDFETSSNRCDKENSTGNKFSEFRRRKYLQNTQYAGPPTNLLNQTILNGCQQCRTNGNGNGQNNQNGQNVFYGKQKSPMESTAYAKTKTSPLTVRGVCNRDNLPGLRSLSSTSGQNIESIFQSDRLRKTNSQNSLTANINVNSTGVGGSGVAPKRTHSHGCLHGSISEYFGHSPPTIRVSSSLERKPSTSSGCRININIKGLNENPLLENLAIKIEADGQTLAPTPMPTQTSTPTPIPMTPEKSTHTLLKPHAFGNNPTVGRSFRRTSNLVSYNNRPRTASLNNLTTKMNSKARTHNYNITASSSSQTFVIDKRISKFSMHNHDDNRTGPSSSRSNDQQQPRSGLQRDREKATTSEVLRERRLRELTGEKYCKAMLRPTGVGLARSLSSARERPAMERVPGIMCLDRSDSTVSQSQRKIVHSTASNKSPSRVKRCLQQRAASEIPHRQLQLHQSAPPKTDKVKVLHSAAASSALRTRSRSHDSFRSVTNANAAPMNSLSFKPGGSGSCRSFVAQSLREGTNDTDKPLNLNINVYTEKLKLLRV